MPENEDYRKLLDVKFNNITESLNIHFEVINNKLENINTQVVRTNSRVNHLEDNVKSIDLYNAKNSNVCNQIGRFEKIEKDIENFKTKTNTDLSEWRLIMKYPKLAVGILVFVIYTSLGTYGNYKNTTSSSTIVKHNEVLNEEIIKHQEDLNKLNQKVITLEKIIDNTKKK